MCPRRFGHNTRTGQFDLFLSKAHTLLYNSSSHVTASVWFLLLPPYREANLDRSPNIVLKKNKRLSLFTTTSLTENRTRINNYLQH